MKASDPDEPQDRLWVVSIPVTVVPNWVAVAHYDVVKRC